MTNPETYLSVPEAARLLGISRAAGYAAAARGELPTVRVGRAIRVIRAEFYERYPHLRPPSAAA